MTDQGIGEALAATDRSWSSIRRLTADAGRDGLVPLAIDTPDRSRSAAFALGSFTHDPRSGGYSKMIHEFKAGTPGNRPHAGFFARCAAAALLEIPRAAIDRLVVAPVPAKAGERPDDNALYELAGRLEHTVRVEELGGLVVERGALRFVSAVPSLKSIAPAERSEAIGGQVQAAHARGRHVVVLDDVFATGSTARECVRALLSESAACVAYLALAAKLSGAFDP